MKRNKDDHRSFWYSLVFTKEHHLDLTFLFCLMLVLTGCIAVLCECLTGGKTSNAGYGFIGGAFSLALLAAIPINKARILASSNVPGNIAQSLSQAITAPSNEKAGLIHEVMEAIDDKTPNTWAHGNPDEGKA